MQEIKRGDIKDKISASGKVEPKGGLNYVLAETNGKIVKLSPNVAVGKTVNKGEDLIYLDDATARFQVKAAEEAVNAAKSQLTQARAYKKEQDAKREATQIKLKFARERLEIAQKEKSESVPGADLNDKRRALEESEAEARAYDAAIESAQGLISAAEGKVAYADAGLDLAKRGLEQTKITSPTAGLVLELNKFVKEGQLIGPQAGPLITVSPNPDQWEVKAQISEQDIGKILTRLNTGEPIPVTFSTEAYSAENQIKFTGKVMSIGALPTTSQRSSIGGSQEALLMAALSGGGGGSSSGPANYPVTISVDPVPDNLRKTHPLFVGYTATDLQIVLNHYKNVVCVPSTALSFTPEGLSDAQQKELKKSEDEGWSTIWFWSNGDYEPKHIKAGASEEGRTQVLEVKGGKPEDLLNKSVVTEGPKKEEKGGLLPKFKIPG
jgi:multidrug resistance efflux pump